MLIEQRMAASRRGVTGLFVPGASLADASDNFAATTRVRVGDDTVHRKPGTSTASTSPQSHGAHPAATSLARPIGTGDSTALAMHAGRRGSATGWDAALTTADPSHPIGESLSDR
jgi:hypothetical protein